MPLVGFLQIGRQVLFRQKAHMAIRYMGTKKALAPQVRKAIESLGRQGRVADLFAGVGSVTAELAPDFPVVANDAMGFTGALLRARFIDREQISAASVASQLLPKYLEARDRLREEFMPRLAAEQVALSTRQKLAHYMDDAPHVGNSTAWQNLAAEAAARTGRGHYLLATLYFSAGYFSTRQALEIDSIRYAIDHAPTGIDRDWLLSAWIAAMSTVVNAPGHTAQYLKPSTDPAFDRLRRQWRRKVWEVFVSKLESIERVGNRAWRAANVVVEGDALALVEELRGLDVGVVYADPPYTRDQYSRFYHVYETLFLYDYPNSNGSGRYRSDRFVTAFSHASKVEGIFASFFDSVSEQGVALVLSYPDSGLLEQRGVSVQTMLLKRFTSVERRTVDHFHSTLGASGGTRRVSAKENLYVCIP